MSANRNLQCGIHRVGYVQFTNSVRRGVSEFATWVSVRVCPRTQKKLADPRPHSVHLHTPFPVTAVWYYRTTL